MKTFYVAFTIAFLLLGFGGVELTWAQCSHQTLVQSDSYAERAPARLVHGILNVVSSPVQLFTEPRHTIQCEKPDLIYGLGSGVIATGKYLILGSWDLLTFWIPGDSGKSVAVTECGWEQAARGCDPSTCSMSSTASEPKN